MIQSGQFNAGYAVSDNARNIGAIQSPQHPIPAALGQLGTAIHEMGVTAESLANRLGVVLMPTAPQTSGEAKGLNPVSSNSQQTDEIHSLRRRVENITGQLQDVLNRLEV